MKTQINRFVSVLTILMALQIAANAQEFASPTLNSWSSGAPMPTARQGVATGFIKGKMYVVSGATNNTVTAVNEIYNVLKNTWTTGAPIPTPRFVPASAVVNNILYVIPQFGHGSIKLTVLFNDPTDPE
jgi:hypothetical protein